MNEGFSRAILDIGRELLKNIQEFRKDGNYVVLNYEKRFFAENS